MPEKKKKKPWAVFVAIGLAIVVGSWTGKEMGLFGVSFYSLYDIIGKLFINSLTLIIVPLVSSSIITGVARIGKDGQFGRIGAKTFGFYFLTKIIAIIIGIVLINLIQPGKSNVGSVSSLIDKSMCSNTAGEAFSKMLLDLIPPNVLDAFAKGNMLGLIFFSIIFGYAITHIAKKASEVHMLFWKGVFEASINPLHHESSPLTGFLFGGESICRNRDKFPVEYGPLFPNGTPWSSHLCTRCPPPTPQICFEGESLEPVQSHGTRSDYRFLDKLILSGPSHHP